MKRNKPMKRSGFKRPVYERTPSPPPAALRQLTPTAAAARVVPLVTTFNPQPKFTYYRSETLQMACRTIPCQAFPPCGQRVGVHWAHSNWEVHGKGGAIKASDQFVAAMCARCHRELDQGRDMSERQRQMFWWHAHQASVKLLLALDRWPDTVPVPDVVNYPFPQGSPAANFKALEFTQGEPDVQEEDERP